MTGKDTEAKMSLKKFEQANFIAEEDIYSYNEEEYDKEMEKRPWKKEY